MAYNWTEKECWYCGKTCIHSVRRKQASNRSSSYTRRTVVKCKNCQAKEINNKKTGKKRYNGIKEKERG